MVYNRHDEDVCLLVTNNVYNYVEIISYVGWLTKHQNDDFNKKKYCYQIFIVKIVFLDPENILLHTKIVRIG